MGRTQRIALLAGTVVLLAVALIVAKPGSDDKDTSTQPVATQPAPAATPTTAITQTTAPPVAAPPAPAPPLLVAGKVKKITVSKGDTVRLRARSATDDEIHVHGYDLMLDVPAGKTVTMTFKAKLDGIYEIEFEKAGTQIAQLRVNP